MLNSPSSLLFSLTPLAVLAWEETVDSRIRVRAPLAPVDHIEMLEGEPELSSEFLHSITQLSGREGGELVEQRLD
jgi:hypothetical protein